MSKIEKIDWLAQMLYDSKLIKWKEELSTYSTLDKAIYEHIKNKIFGIPNSLKNAHYLLLRNLDDVYSENQYETKFKEYEYFKDICFQVKADFKSTYKFEIIQEETDTEYLEVKVNIHTTLKDYTFILTEKTQIDDNQYKSRVSFNIGKDMDIWYLHKPDVREEFDFTAFDADKIYNFTKMINQILSQTKKENKEYKLDLKANKKYFLSSKKTVEQIEDENIDKLIEELKNDFVAVGGYPNDSEYLLVNNDLKINSKLTKKQNQTIKLIIDRDLLPVPLIKKRYFTQYVLNKRLLKNGLSHLENEKLISDTNYQKRQLEYFNDIKRHTENPSQVLLDLIIELEQIIPMMEQELKKRENAATKDTQNEIKVKQLTYELDKLNDNMLTQRLNKENEYFDELKDDLEWMKYSESNKKATIKDLKQMIQDQGNLVKSIQSYKVEKYV